jgi:signal transduction histidine kinase
MVQHPTHSPYLVTDLQPGLQASQIPRQFVADFPRELPVPAAGPRATGGRVRARSRAIREVMVVEASGRLADVVEDLDRAIQLALADGPRGVVCDLSAVSEGAEPIAIEVLATAGRHVRDWPGIPVAVACQDQRVREALAAHPLGRHLILTTSLFSAVTAVLATPTLTVESRRLAPHPTAPRASRTFVTRTLLDWRLGRVIPFATLVVSELVSSSSMSAGTDIDVSVVWNLGALRLTVRDHGPGMPPQEHSDLDLHGRGLTVVAGLSRAFGVLPGADGGKVVWAVLEAPRPRPSARRVRSQLASASKESPEFTDGRGLASPPFCAGPTKRATRVSRLPTADEGPTLVR